MRDKRVDWIDVYKAFAIMLVVVGHATGLFNMYIYQFHMACFFFISGYTAKLEEKSIVEICLDKLFTCFIPLLFFVLSGAIVQRLLNSKGIYDMCSNLPYVGIGKTLSIFLTKGDIYVQFLGAGWFLITLMGAFIIQKLIILISKNQANGIYALISIFIYFFGYYMIHNNIKLSFGMFSFDLIFVSQLFLGIGYCVKKNLNSLIQTQWKMKYLCPLGCACIIIFYLFGKVYPMTVDYPSRYFPNPIFNLIAGLNGIFFVLIISKILADNKWLLWIRKAFCYIGKNSISILFMHFIWIKLINIIFYKHGIISLEDVRSVVPTVEVGNKFWVLFLLVSVLASLLVWEIFRRIPGIRWLLGFSRESYKKISSKVVGKIAGRKAEDSSVITEVKKNINNHKLLCIIIIALIFIVVLPLWRQGIMCNDELQSRYWSYQGFKEFYKHFLRNHIEKGRALSTVIVSFTMYLGFLGQSTWTFKILQILSILICIALFSILTYKVLGNKRFCIFVGVCNLLFLPVTFEHTAPNAFSTLYNVPLAILFLSMILFVKYISEDRNRDLIISMILLFIAEISYEAFIMYVPLYCLYAIVKKGIKKENIIKNVLIPIGNAVLFLGLYVISAKLFPSNYTGNQIQITSIKNSIKIIAELFMSTLPGRYLFSSKYIYLTKYYYTNNWSNIIRVCVLSILVIAVFRKLISTKNLNIKGKAFKSIILVLLFCVAGAVAPIIPISVSSMYQNIIGESGFMALPVTFFGYFWSVLLFSYIIWQIAAGVKNDIVTHILIAGCVLLIIPIQIMNDTIADEEYSNFRRLETIEDFVKSATMSELQGYTFYSTDLYERRNTLAIHDGFWTDYARVSGLNIQIKNGEAESDSNKIYIVDDCIFEIWIGSQLRIMSKKQLNSPVVVQKNEMDWQVVKCAEYSQDETGWYVYCFEGNDLIPVDELSKIVGNTLETCEKVEGYYGDNWLETKSVFNIQTKEFGIVNIGLYNPGEYKDGDKVDFLVDGEMVLSVPAQEGYFEVSVPAKSNVIIELQIITNFLQADTGEDQRPLAIMINELEGE